MKQVTLKLREDKSYGMPKPSSMALVPISEFIDDVFGKEKLMRLEQLVKGEISSYGYNMTHQERIHNSIVISSEYSGYPDIKMPIEKFAKLIEKLCSIAHLRHTKEKPKEIIFKFADDWNCEVEIIK